jgi:hypothetical protein
MFKLTIKMKKKYNLVSMAAKKFKVIMRLRINPPLLSDCKRLIKDGK